MNQDKVLYKDLSYRIMGVLFDVYNELGYGYQEKHYGRAVENRFIAKNIQFKRQPCFRIVSHGEEIGRYFLDFLVEDKIVLELKQGNFFAKSNIHQVRGYLKATGMKLGILANFTSENVKFMRILNDR